jgi:hypothetical protein
MTAVKIGPHKFPIVYVDKVNEDDDWGLYSQASQDIKLSNQLLPEGSKWAEILIHEIFHGIADQFESFEDSEEHVEEKIVRAFALGFTQVLQNNPTLFRQILRALKK